ncbi:MAG: hypothetical protein COA32_01625 [Fluviicola sp.]|nr:MAG: hypothetical protein COA32_01625 [Fluviicola sp.]
MKNGKSTLFLAATIVTVLNFSSCSKYEDGPMFSLRTKKARLTGEWEVVRIGNETFPQDGYSVEMEFEKDGDFRYTYSYDTYSYSYNGEWEFSSDKEEVDIIIDNQVETFEILRLKNDELWLEASDNTEWRLEAK